MKFIKRTFLTILILMFFGIIFRGWLYRHLVKYRSVGARNIYSVTDDKLTDCINTNLIKLKDPDIVEIVELGLSITSRKLSFSSDKNDIDPNKLISSHKANCVGYASFFATTCNFLLQQYNLDNNWTARPQIGHLFFLETNIHKYFNSSFFNDHDFVIIENKTTGEILAFDPTLNDYFCIDFITFTK